MAKGRVRGINNEPTHQRASGTWSVDEIHNSLLNATWPGSPVSLTSGVLENGTGIFGYDTGLGTQKHWARCADGQLWAIYPDQVSGFGSYEAYYSNNNGATWAYGTSLHSWSSPSWFPSCSIVIDSQDRLHFVYKNPISDGRVKYVRYGARNGGKTSWTSASSTVDLDTSSTRTHPDLAVQELANGSTVAQIVGSFIGAGAENAMMYARVTVNSSHTATLNQTWQSMYYNAGTLPHTTPSIDISDDHTRIGVYWSGGASGSGYGLRFRVATIDGNGVPSWATEQQIASSVYLEHGAPNNQAQNSFYWLACRWDKVYGKWLLGDHSWTGAALNCGVYICNGTTGANEGSAGIPVTASLRLERGSMAVDHRNGNVYMVGINDGGSAMHYRKLTRTGATTFSVGSLTNWVSASFGGSAGGGWPNCAILPGTTSVGALYTEGSGSPFSIKFAAMEAV